MLLAIPPHSVIDSTILPGELALALSLVVNEVALVLFAIFPCEHTVTMHLVLFPLTFIGLAVGPYISTFARDFIHLKVTKVD